MWYYYLIGALALIAIVFGIIAIVFAVKNKKKKEEIDAINSDNKADDVKIVDGVRYTNSSKEMEGEGDIAITHNVGDIILKMGKEYTVETLGTIIPGKYTILSTSDSDEKFNIRIGEFVREYSHRDNIVLAEGQKICAVSHDVILR